jgi:hypothetical protein
VDYFDERLKEDGRRSAENQRSVPSGEPEGCMIEALMQIKVTAVPGGDISK